MIETIKPIESPFLFMDSQSTAWMAIVDYVLRHEDEIKADIDDYSTLKPVLDFFNRDVDCTGQTLVNKIIPGKVSQEYLNGELVENIDTGPDLEIGGAGGLGKFNGFMSEDRE